ncbi:MAG TPA: pH regulation protein F, partial [Rhodospirillales bacterium]|nr:pH regulation protein F [Rhodospirillales bacterium]
MFTVAAIAIIVAMMLAIIRAVLGPTVYDRILAL